MKARGNMDRLIQTLQTQNIQFQLDHKLSAVSSFRIGGNTDIAVFPHTEEEIATVIRACIYYSLRFLIVGNASNLLFSDDGYRGVIIFTRDMNLVTVDQASKTVSCMCGAKLSYVANQALSASLSGLEFAHGIPGSVGGAVYMNAGAYGAQISDILLQSRAYDIKNDCFLTIDAASHDFDYRQSIYMKNKDLVVISTVFGLRKSSKYQIEALMKENAQKRRNSQPLQYPSAGSYFKRPVGHFAGKLIDDCGLKGKSIGGAQVSEKHAGFIINLGNATAKDVLELSEHVKRTVFERFSVELESEVEYIDQSKGR